jgi:hypothetical protein
MVAATALKTYRVEVSFNGMTSLLNFRKNLPIGSKVDRSIDTQDGDLISLHFSFRKQSRIKMVHSTKIATLHEIEILLRYASAAGYISQYAVGIYLTMEKWCKHVT